MLLLAALFACAHPVAPVAAPTAPSATPAPASEEDHLPYLFTPDQLRDSLVEGTVIRMRIETAGQPTVVEQWTFSHHSAESVNIHTLTLDEAGKQLSDDGDAPAAWEELQKHGTFPAARSTLTRAPWDGPRGHTDAVIIAVADADDSGHPLTKTYVFSAAEPGPPLSFTIQAEGMQVFAMTQLSREVPAQ